MFKKTMKFDDLEGNEVEETFYFHLNRLEIAEMLELDQLDEKVTRLTKAKEEKGLNEVENTREAYNIFKDLILRSYGIKGDDNRTFKKSEEIRDSFKDHVAFEELIFEFIGNESYAAEFFENCLPTKLVEAAKADLAAKQAAGENVGDNILVAPAPTETGLKPDPDTEKTINDYSRAELLEMDQKLFDYLAGTDPQKMDLPVLQIAMQRKNTQ